MPPRKKSPLNKKKAIRKMRKTSIKYKDGSTASHKMSYVGDTSKRRKGDFGVYPTITPKKGKKTSRKPSDWTKQTSQQAEAKGEMINVKSRRRAQKLAAGSWKKGEERKEAMKKYRATKKSNRKKR